MNAFIKAIRFHLPPKVVTNEELRKEHGQPNRDATDARTGIIERRVVEPHVVASDLAYESSIKLFSECDVCPENIDFLLFCSQEFDHLMPATACLLHQRLGLPRHAGALDFNLGCSGFVYGLSLAKGLIESAGLDNVLFLTASTGSRMIHPKDHSSRLLFGDGAAATLVSARPKRKGIGEFHFGTDGGGAERIIIRDGGGRHPLTEESNIETMDEYGNASSRASLQMDGPAVFSFSMKTVPDLVETLLQKSSLKKEEIDLFIFHQANALLLETLRKKLDIPPDRFFVALERFGNTVASTIPIALHEAMAEGRARSGQKVLLAGFGIGWSWAATVVEL